jgi:hypothetical protein
MLLQKARVFVLGKLDFYGLDWKFPHEAYSKGRFVVGSAKI